MASPASQFQENEPATLTCPRCGLTSHHLEDVKHRFCGNCAIFLEDAAPFLIMNMKHEDVVIAQREGWIYVHKLPDGRYLGIEPATFGSAFLKLCFDDQMEDGRVDDVWQYERLAFAINAAATWDASRDREPFGWYRHPGSGRRRPFGNPQSEYVRP